MTAHLSLKNFLKRIPTFPLRHRSYSRDLGKVCLYACWLNCTVNFYWRPWPSRLWATRPACQTSFFPSSTMQPAYRTMSFLPTYNSIMATFSFFSHFKYITGSKAWENKQKICIIHHWSSRRFLSFYSPKPRSQVWIFLKYIGIGLS